MYGSKTAEQNNGPKDACTSDDDERPEAFWLRGIAWIRARLFFIFCIDGVSESRANCSAVQYAAVFAS
jgi:hypothetical protein